MIELSYLNSLYIKKFRGINDLSLEKLSKINILVGDNNCGKTSVLEAISFFQNPECMGSILMNSCKRGRGLDAAFDLFLDVFPMNNLHKEIDISSNINFVDHKIKLNGKVYEDEKRVFDGSLTFCTDSEKVLHKNITLNEEHMSKIKINNNDKLINIVYVTPYEYLRSKYLDNAVKIIKNNNMENVITLLKLFDDNIEDFEIVENENRSNIYVKHSKNGLMSLSSFGDGIKKVIALAASVCCAKDGILLIDEIETAIYKNILKGVFSWVIKACDMYNIQLVATTHSLDVIDAFIESMDDLDSLACFRLEYYEEELYSNRINGQKLKDIRRVLGQDVR